MLNKPSNVCQRRLCSNRFDRFHFRTFLNYGKLLESVVFHSGRWGTKRAVRNGVLVRFKLAVPSKLNVCAFWSTLYTTSPLFLTHHCANRCHWSLLAFILVCSACLIKSWSHILCSLRNQIVTYVKMLSLSHLDANRRECVLWLMDTSAITKKAAEEGSAWVIGTAFLNLLGSSDIFTGVT